jgi:uncharacterized protein YjeT (DUF2065 family)
MSMPDNPKRRAGMVVSGVGGMVLSLSFLGGQSHAPIWLRFAGFGLMVLGFVWELIGRADEQHSAKSSELFRDSVLNSEEMRRK